MSNSTIDPTSGGGARAHSPDSPVVVRTSSGLIKGWSSYDAFIYNFLGANPILLGLYTFSLAPVFPGGNIIWAVVISGLILLLQSFVSAALISVMPRTGGDYLWQSRLIHGGVGFVVAGVAWWFTIWHWGPLYNSSFVQGLYAPVASTLGLHQFTAWLSTPIGIFIGSLALIGFVTLVVSLDLRTYAKVQKFGFYLGLVTLLVFFVVLLVNSNTDFIEAFNTGAAQTFGAGPDAYQAALQAGQYNVGSEAHLEVAPTLLLIPLVLFFNIWCNIGSALYGEVRGASDFRRTFLSMAGAVILTTTLATILLVLIGKTMGWEWYNAINNAYFAGSESNPIPIWPSPLLFAAWLLHNKFLTILLFIGISGWYWGFVGNLFLASSRTIFAIAYDRILPEWFASVSPKRGVPVGALITLAGGCVVLSAAYAYVPNFDKLTLDGIVPIAIVGLVTAISAAILPWRARRLFESSPLARWKVAGVPAVTLAGVAYAVFLAAVVYAWLAYAEYGVNNALSLCYLGFLYALAIAIYAAAWFSRRRRGFSLDLAQKEIPVD
jgi:APA family basic amino acid/polyamine antiporter